MGSKTLRPLVDVRDLTLRTVADTRSGHGARTIVERVCIAVGDGQMVGLIGPSGSGKTTLARAIADVLPPELEVVAGRIDRPTGQWAIHTAFQNGRTSLDPFSTLDRVVGRCLDRARRSAGAADVASVEACLRLAGLDPAVFAGRYAFELSGGEARRASLALAFATPARLIIADEPTAGLDPALKVELAERLGALRRPGRGVLLVTHAIGLFHDRVDALFAISPGRPGATALPRGAAGAAKTPAAPLFEAALRLGREARGGS